MSEYNIESDITIDSYNLENECISMASTYYRYADLAREAKSLVSEKADNVKVVRAERAIAIREYCASSDYNGVKVTEGVITAMVEKDPDVLAANKELRDAEATFDKLSVMVKSMEIKKGELDNLVKLKCNGTYVDNMTKPTKNLNAEASSEYLRNSMSRVPTKFED